MYLCFKVSDPRPLYLAGLTGSSKTFEKYANEGQDCSVAVRFKNKGELAWPLETGIHQLQPNKVPLLFDEENFKNVLFKPVGKIVKPNGFGNFDIKFSIPYGCKNLPLVTFSLAYLDQKGAIIDFGDIFEI